MSDERDIYEDAYSLPQHTTHEQAHKFAVEAVWSAAVKSVWAFPGKLMVIPESTSEYEAGYGAAMMHVHKQQQQKESK